jgi:REP element-mobilizing transposase RayT
MARPLRIEYDGAVYHVTSRGNAKKPIFKDDIDRRLFLNILEKVTKRYNWLCHAYCLMGNHFHLAIETPDGNLSKGMKHLNGVYTQTFNKKNRRVGHVFQGRYKAILIQKESHLLEVCRYIVLNPVRAGIETKPDNWRWSSYRATAGIGKPHPCLTIDWVLGQFHKNRNQAQKEYRRFVIAAKGKERIWSEIRAQSILGEDEFTENLIKYAKGFEDIKEIPRNQRYFNRPTLHTLLTEKIMNNRKKKIDMVVRAVEKHGYSQKEIADYLGVHYSAISRMVNCQK